MFLYFDPVIEVIMLCKFSMDFLGHIPKALHAQHVYIFHIGYHTAAIDQTF